MGIIPTKKAEGVSRADVACDACDRRDTVTAFYERLRGGKWQVNKGQIVAKITAQGWSDVKGKIYCPACTAKRKAFKMKPKNTTVTEIRQPDGKQKRLIIMALEDAYDDVKKCYHGQETDKTVANNLGDGVMPGWVTKIREELFGPAGNEEVMKIFGEIAALAAKSEKAQTDFKKSLDDLRKRVDAAVSAHDRRAG